MSDRPISSTLHPLKTFQRLFGYIFKGYKLQLVFVVISILISAIAGTLGIVFTKVLIDNFIVPLMKQENPDFSQLLSVLLIMLVVYYVGVICTYIYNRLMIIIAQGVLKDIRDEMFEHMEKLSIRYFDQHTTGDVMSRYTNDADTLRQMISQSLPQTFSALITVISIIVAMFALNIPLTFFVLFMLLIMVSVTRLVANKSGQYFSKQQYAIGEVNGYVEEMIEGQKVVKVFNHEKRAQEQFALLNENLYQQSALANTYASILMPILGNLGNFSYLLTAVVGSILSITGIAPLTLGVLASFVQFTKAITQPVSQISQQLNSVIMAIAGAERIFNLFDEVPEENSGKIQLVNAKYNETGKIEETLEKTGQWAWKKMEQDGSVHYIPLTGDVRFKDVTFGYNKNKVILHDLSLFAKPGQKIAFVGATGAGKTTITNLINRFYDIDEGEILYDGLNIKSINKNDLRRSLGIVLQDTHLFTGTIRENIRYGRLEATDEEVIAAAKLANVHEFISKLPHGYDTFITGDGGSLSQGQRQLLAIARAAVADPPVLILDEATSNIDTRTESIIQRGMDSLMKGRTVFVIAHRLSTVRNSNAIIVLDQGRIIERGSHDDLMEQKGNYYQLYTGAFELS